MLAGSSFGCVLVAAKPNSQTILDQQVHSIGARYCCSRLLVVIAVSHRGWPRRAAFIFVLLLKFEASGSAAALIVLAGLARGLATRHRAFGSPITSRLTRPI